MKSKYQAGWVGLRVRRTGNAARLLKRRGWWKVHHAEINNRNGFDWVLPGITRSQFVTHDWRELANAGLEAVAIWFTDAQWGHAAGITDKQWRARIGARALRAARWPLTVARTPHPRGDKKHGATVGRVRPGRGGGRGRKRDESKSA